MRKIVLALIVGVVFVVMAAGAALAVTKVCGESECVGTKGPDILTGTGIDNTINGLAGNDTIDDNTNKTDKDTIDGGRGEDRIDVREGNSKAPNKDFVNCGSGKDTVWLDKGDTRTNCERVRVGNN